MYELLIRIETLYLEAAPGILFAIGAAAILVGLLFWLAGALFSPIIIGLMGAAFGAAAGLIVSNLFNLNLLRAAVFGAAAFCLAAILFRNVIIIGLAVAVFALATGTAYSSFILSKLPPLHQKPAFTSIQSFSRMDPELRLSYLEQIAQAEASFLDKLNALLRDTANSIAPHKWHILLAVLAGAVVCLILLWRLRKLVFALCYSLIGAFLLFLGAESLFMAARIQICAAFKNCPLTPTIAYFILAAAGAILQLTLTKPRKHEQPHIKELRALAEALTPAKTPDKRKQYPA
jgi:hypothetical protein